MAPTLFWAQDTWIRQAPIWSGRGDRHTDKRVLEALVGLWWTCAWGCSEQTCREVGEFSWDLVGRLKTTLQTLKGKWVTGWIFLAGSQLSQGCGQGALGALWGQLGKAGGTLRAPVSF